MGDKVHLGKAPVSLDPALQKGESVEDRNERLRTGKFEDKTSFGEKVSKKIGNVVEPIYNSVAKIAAPAVKRDEEKMRKGGMVSSASKRADGCAVKGKTKGRMV